MTNMDQGIKYVLNSAIKSFSDEDLISSIIAAYTLETLKNIEGEHNVVDGISESFFKPLSDKEISLSTTDSAPKAMPLFSGTRVDFTPNAGDSDDIILNHIPVIRRILQDNCNQIHFVMKESSSVFAVTDVGIFIIGAREYSAFEKVTVLKIFINTLDGLGNSEKLKLDLGDEYVLETAELPKKRENDNTFVLDILVPDPSGGMTSSLTRLLFDNLEEILKTNYNQSVIDKTLLLYEQIKNKTFLGKILFFHGEPGTGKTFLLRSLMGSILPYGYESLLVTHPNYFMQQSVYFSLLEGRHDSENSMFLLFEDAASLISKDSRVTTPDAFSSLTNLTSGLIGSGRRDILCFTFNEDEISIDNALIRECRNMGNIVVGPMEEDTIRRFKEHHDLDADLKEGCTLADAYSALFRSTSVKTKDGAKKRKIGFG